MTADQVSVSPLHSARSRPLNDEVVAQGVVTAAVMERFEPFKGGDLSSESDCCGLCLRQDFLMCCGEPRATGIAALAELIQDGLVGKVE